ncbi:cell division protein CrgA [Corynebacterium sp. TAE3-ERU12]|uniref:cell division protein CrgA n=1 Tax=Corynebacterium sp. TAE3-ERU12 TaxID=2849491 RepID=UPI001C45FDAC|nr:cell division protein CrgA [Corynebacterium sp. TAE3-ERU12]MBV7294360.1 cell division protein CrgA [Corynebacterium sp. TAE3-ERU12]
MPKAKVDYNADNAPGGGGISRTPVKINTTSTPLWYKIVMFGLMAIGMLWLVVNYIAGPHIPFMVELGAWNFLIGFGLFIIGLLMTMGWR